ncbi:DNA-3-methyladenine glycosylase 2 [Massilia arenosa]|uniref:DNA-3-methyladenine glycosylase II n=1 Tax=Zemynaea arenosa TaxID=2561931 RepID=A0A4Y9RW88_9BURK|nr:DNA-3-methyladenine glycosylase 2 [Massilia arenosa]TFW13232.1 DNA-3-methyladenine glycosylase 2 [Massilia arenosa]
MATTVRIPLPRAYRVADILAFHSRDVEGVAEQVRGGGLRKGLLLAGVPVVLDVAFTPAEAVCVIDHDGRLSKSARALADDALLNILGLRIDPAPFLKFARAHPHLGALARQHKGLRIVQSATIFEALTWAIIGQQINLTFAIALRRTFILQAGRQHSSGLWCYPEAQDVARLDLDELTSRKFSRAKAETLLRLARMVAEGAVTLDRNHDLDETMATLLSIKGIGPWTVNYALLRGYGYADCSLHGDVAIRTAMQRVLGTEERPDIAETERWLAQFSPHRTMTAAHLWASLAHE